jgi:hypothetical protein
MGRAEGGLALSPPDGHREVWKTIGPQRKNVMRSLSRLWAGIVAAVAGVALAVVAQVAGQMAIGLPTEYLEELVVCPGSLY